MNFEELKFNEQGLIVAIVQDYRTGEVLMQAYMNKESLEETLKSGYATYWSRSRNELWKKGETSGSYQIVKSIKYDCDGDSLLVIVDQQGTGACHTGNKSCFYRTLKDFDFVPDYKIVFDVANTIKDRKINPQEGSYTNYLFAKGVEKICKKIGEEATESVIAAIAGKNDELICELSDLLYHSLVLMEDRGINMYDVFHELMNREGKAPNPKYKKLMEKK